MYSFKGSSISSAISTGYLKLAQNQIVNETGLNTNYTFNGFINNSYNIESML